ncbi:MAG: sirohydrochlorin cobaltochelatase [Oscillospiraceae bacterium]
MSEKQAVLAVSFGTSHLDTLKVTIEAIENDLAAAFPHHTLRRAFTSGMICRKLKERDGLEVDSVSQALERLAGEGYTGVILQPSHVINGEEYDKLLEQARPFVPQFESLKIGAPLLTTLADYYAVAQALFGELPELREDTALVFMGHGTAHLGNPAYAQLEYICHDLHRQDILLATVEGYPDFDALVRRLEERPKVRNIQLAPLMIVAGDHAKNDLAGAGPASWYSRLTALGYEVSCNLRGLGEYPALRGLLVAHAQNAPEYCC